MIISVIFPRSRTPRENRQNRLGAAVSAAVCSKLVASRLYILNVVQHHENRRDKCVHYIRPVVSDISAHTKSAIVTIRKNACLVALANTEMSKELKRIELGRRKLPLCNRADDRIAYVLLLQ